jgi:Tol biopolymer transport system component
MKVSRLAFSLLMLIAFAVLASDSPDTREITDPNSLTSQTELGAGPVPIDDLFFTRGIIGPSWSPNSHEIAFSTNITGRYNLWKVDAAGGWPIQLSQSDDRQTNPVWSPDGKWIVFESDKGGGEIYDLFSIPSEGGEITNLTLTPDISETTPVWSPDGSRLALNYKPKTASAIDIAILDWKTRAVHNLTQEKTKDHNWANPFWSPDGKTIYASRANANFTDSDVYRVDVATGTSENLTPHEGQRRTFVSSVSSDGHALLVGSDKPGGFPNVALLDLATKQLTWATDTKWEANAGDFPLTEKSSPTSSTQTAEATPSSLTPPRAPVRRSTCRRASTPTPALRHHFRQTAPGSWFRIKAPSSPTIFGYTNSGNRRAS